MAARRRDVMEDHAKSILGNLVQVRFQLGHNFPEILNVLEDTAAAAIVQAAHYPQSNLIGNKPEDILEEFIKRTRGKISELEGIIKFEMELQAAAKAKAEDGQ
jgi:hypothetical protein